jgi:hypothetical protein
VPPFFEKQIDNNPFLVFEIHNVNLLEKLRKRGLLKKTPQKNEVGFEDIKSKQDRSVEIQF